MEIESGSVHAHLAPKTAFLPTTGRSQLDKERRVTCEDPFRPFITLVLATVKPTFRSPSQSGWAAVSSPLPRGNPIWVHEENTGREDRGQPDLEQGQESGQDWNKEDKTY